MFQGTRCSRGPGVPGEPGVLRDPCVPRDPRVPGDPGVPRGPVIPRDRDGPGVPVVPGVPDGLGNPCELWDILNHLDHLRQFISWATSIAKNNLVIYILLACIRYPSWSIINYTRYR